MDAHAAHTKGPLIVSRVDSGRIEVIEPVCHTLVCALEHEPNDAEARVACDADARLFANASALLAFADSFDKWHRGITINDLSTLAEQARFALSAVRGLS